MKLPKLKKAVSVRRNITTIADICFQRYVMYNNIRQFEIAEYWKSAYDFLWVCHNKVNVPDHTFLRHFTSEEST